MTIDTDTVYTSQDGVYESEYVFGSLGIWFIRVDYDGDDAYKYSYTKKLYKYTRLRPMNPVDT